MKCRFLPVLLAAAFLLFIMAGCEGDPGKDDTGFTDTSFGSFLADQAQKLDEAMEYYYGKGFSAERIVRDITGSGPEEDTSVVGQAAQSITEEISDAAKNAAQAVVDEAAEAAEQAVHNVVEETRKSILDRIIGLIKEVFD